MSGKWKRWDLSTPEPSWPPTLQGKGAAKTLPTRLRRLDWHRHFLSGDGPCCCFVFCFISLALQSLTIYGANHHGEIIEEMLLPEPEEYHHISIFLRQAVNWHTQKKSVVVHTLPVIHLSFLHSFLCQEGVGLGCHFPSLSPAHSMSIYIYIPIYLYIYFCNQIWGPAPHPKLPNVDATEFIIGMGSFSTLFIGNKNKERRQKSRVDGFPGRR